MAVAPALVGVAVAADMVLEDQPLELAPRRTEKGVLFSVQAPGAAKVHLAGSFNNWADNKEGLISSDAYALKKDPDADVWTGYVNLPAGSHRFKFVVEGVHANAYWFVPNYVVERDPTGNGVIVVSQAGNVFFNRGNDPRLRPQKKNGEVTFRFWAPHVNMVYLAGDFNNWADNREGLVVSAAAEMEGPDSDGVWTKTVSLLPGEHHYQFVIDGETWVTDPNEENRVENHSIVRID